LVPFTVSCLYCKKRIGSFRRLTDKHFCCNEHRKKLMSKSARAMREAEDLYGADPSRTPNWRAAAEKPEEPTDRRAGFGSVVFVAVAVLGLALAASQIHGTGPGPKAVSALPDTNASSSQSKVGQFLGNLIQAKSGSLREDFHAGIGNWDGGKIGADWALEPGHVRPASLRLWKQSEGLSNYEMQFMGQIEQKSIDWAFRAPDAKNYYGTKLMITRPGPRPNAGLVRFIVLDGRERERVELPLPLTLDPGVDYQVRVSVQGNHFLTSVNGQLVSSWSDNRLSRGGVGFFSEAGESALLKWVSVSNRDSVLARFVSYFSLIAFPAPPTPRD
jgi:hypothetical protein